MTEQPFEGSGLENIELEMAYTPWNESCQDPYVTSDGDLMQCRRKRPHNGLHAAGFTPSLRLWS